MDATEEADMTDVTSRQTIVVGVDASEESDEALEWACTHAGPDDRIVVVHAWDVPLMTSYDVAIAVDPVEIEKMAKRGLDELVDRKDDDRLVPVAPRGHAGRAVIEQAADADLIVVGHRGNSRLSMMLGSTANYVIHHTDLPVVVVRGDHQRPARRVVVGVDDFDDPEDSPSVRALQWAYRVPCVERVTAVHAWYLPPLAIGVMPAASNDMAAMDDAAQRVADRVVAAAGDPPPGVSVTAETARGSGDFAMIEASRAADLVVVGRRGRGGFSELLLGSTSSSTAAHSHAPVAIIH